MWNNCLREIIMKEDFDVHAEDVHMIGHSIGAHVAGYAGERIANLGRITGNYTLFQCL